MEDTFPKLLVRNRQRWGTKGVAVRKKEYGIWREYTWEDCYQKVKDIFLGLSSLGLQSGDRVSILGDNNPEWFWSELAIQAAGGIVLGLNPGSSSKEAATLLSHSQSRFVMAQDQEQVDKLLEIKGELPSLEKIVYWQEKGLRQYDNPSLISLAELIRLGQERQQSHPEYFEQRLSQGKGDDVAMIIFTQGNNAAPKAIPATYQFLLSSVDAALALSPVYVSDEYVSIITPGWFFEQTLGFGTSLAIGQKLNFAERADTAHMDLREISPHTIVYPSQAWGQIANAIQTNVSSGTWLKKTLYKRCLSLGYRMADLSSPNRQASPFKKLGYHIANFLVFRPLRDKHGLNRARVIYTAGGLLSPETARFFRAIGVNMVQVFGSTQSGIVSTPPGKEVNIE